MEKKTKTTKEQEVSAPKPSPLSIDLKKHESECRRIEELLKDVQRQQKAILNNIPDIAWLKDKESRFIAVNESFGKACGLKPEELVGKTDLDIWPHDLARRYRADDQEVMDSGVRKRVEEPLADKEDKIKWIETVKTPIYNNKGEVIGTTGIARDITDRKRLEDKLRESKAELEIRTRIRTAELSKTNEDLRKYISELRQTEEMLRESQARYKAIVENQTEFVCRFLPGDCTTTFVNESYCKCFGRSREELLGKSFLPFISEDDRKKVKDNLASLSMENPVISHEEKVILPNGEIRWQFWTNQMLFDDDGHFMEIQAVGRDITERKNFERALQESELQYRSTIESMSQAIHVVDRGLKVIIANKVFKKWSEALGFSSDIVGKTIFEAFPFLSENVRDEYNQVFETGEILITEENNNIAGKGIITETRKIPIFEEGRVSRVVTVVDEITERKNWEYALRESEERYKRIVDTVTDYIFTVYLEAGKPIKTVYGPTCLAVTGYSPQELTADAYLWINMVHKDDRKAVGDYTGRILSGTENLSIEHRIIKKDGAMRWVRNTSILHFDEAGKLLSYDGIIQDVTESKTVESQISRINECFLSFGTDPLLNVNMLVSLCGELLGADCAMYNRIEGGLLCTIGQWNTPPDFNPKDSPEGHICFDVIKKNEDEILVIRDLRDSPYAKTDPNVTKYGLDTYLGYPVRISGETIGSLCAVYQRDFTPNQEDKKIIGIIASAIGTEEERRKTGEILRQRIEFERIITTISANFIKIEFGDIEPEINKALETIGRFVGVDRSYIFLVNNDQSRTSNAYEWCAEGVEPLKEGLQNIPVDKFPWFYKKIKNLENIYIPRLEDFPKEAAVEKEFISSQGLKSIMIVPMVYGKNPIGFIGFDSVEEKEWSQESILLLRTVGEIFTNTLEHKKAGEKIGAGERFLSNIFNSIQDGISILDKELNIIRVNLTMEQWYEHYRPLAGKKCFQAYHGRKEPCKVCPSIRTLSNGEAAHEVVPKIGAGGEIVGWLDLFSFPLYDEASGKLKGAIEYVRDITDRKRTEKKLEILNKELVKSNQRLKQLSLKDSQTGLFNHRYLGEVMEAEFYRARRYAHPISVLMMDIDYFKSINDVYGHQFGDLALRQLAKYLKKMVRRYDIIIRFGGEEFIIIFPGTDRATALVLAQRLLDSMNTYRFGNKEHEVKLKLSVAVVSYPDDKIIKGMDMVELADQILSKVKESGGNKVYSSVDTKKEKALGSRKKVETGNVKFLQDKLEKLSKRANQSLIESVFAFAKTIEVKDHYTGEHVESTVHYATEIANALGLPKYEIELIKQAAMLHDLGKIGISEKILLKSSKLNKEEFDEIKKHPQIGVDIIRPIQFFHNIIPLMLYHHERWDGKGYPRGLKGEEIPIGARIIAISDVYQALTSHRPYRKKAFSKEEALKIIKDGAGTQFDPKIVPVFLNIVQKEK